MFEFETYKAQRRRWDAQLNLFCCTGAHKNAFVGPEFFHVRSDGRNAVLHKQHDHFSTGAIPEIFKGHLHEQLVTHVNVTLIQYAKTGCFYLAVAQAMAKQILRPVGAFLRIFMNIFCPFAVVGHVRGCLPWPSERKTSGWIVGPTENLGNRRCTEIPRQISHHHGVHVLLHL